ncbi:MAG: hypothetical protein JNJ46_28350 [Myxococcales bacterium]|nr:hypothetical protein [Myxococcales bacterium]
MATDFHQVSLGFAEFVSKLLHETYDALLSAQDHQLERILDQEEMLRWPTEVFRERCVRDEDLAAQEQRWFGMMLAERTPLSPALEEQIRALVPEDQLKAALARPLSKAAIETIRKALAARFVEEQKQRLRALLDVQRSTRLLVDSGEIRAKLELSNLRQSETPGSPQGATQPRVEPSEARPASPSEPRQPVPPSEVLTSPAEAPHVSAALLDSTRRELPLREIIDPTTQQKILIVDRRALMSLSGRASAMPSVRLIATPARQSSSAALLSEVTIRFKTA